MCSATATTTAAAGWAVPGSAADSAPDSAPDWHDFHVTAGGVRWQVRRGGQGPLLLLLHGTGASMASWQACAELLASSFEVLLLDLPGHAGSSLWADGRVSLPRMADALARLLDALHCRPAWAAGHSAGAAVLLQWVLLSGDAAGPSALRGLLSVNGALRPLRGVAGAVFPGLARLLVGQRRWLPRLLARHARDPQAVRRMVEATGSRLDAAGLARYQGLLLQPSHVTGALAMMAGWRLEVLEAALPRLALPLWLVAGTGDRTVPAAQARVLAARLPTARLRELPGLGHLAHEEAPALLASLVTDAWREAPPRPASA